MTETTEQLDLAGILREVFPGTAVAAGSWTWVHVAAALNIREVDVAKEVVEALTQPPPVQTLDEVAPRLIERKITQRQFTVTPRIAKGSQGSVKRTAEELVTLQLWQEAPEEHPLHSLHENENCEEFFRHILNAAQSVGTNSSGPPKSSAAPKTSRQPSWRHVALWMDGDKMPYCHINLEQLLPDGISVNSDRNDEYSLSKLVLQFELAFKKRNGWNKQEWTIYDAENTDLQLQDDDDLQTAIQIQMHLLSFQPDSNPVVFHTKKITEDPIIEAERIPWRIGGFDVSEIKTLGAEQDLKKQQSLWNWERLPEMPKYPWLKLSTTLRRAHGRERTPLAPASLELEGTFREGNYDPEYLEQMWYQRWLLYWKTWFPRMSLPQLYQRKWYSLDDVRKNGKKVKDTLDHLSAKGRVARHHINPNLSNMGHLGSHDDKKDSPPVGISASAEDETEDTAAQANVFDDVMQDIGDQFNQGEWEDCCVFFDFDPRCMLSRATVRVRGMRFPLYCYQFYAVWWIISHSEAEKLSTLFLADQMGFGKSVIILGVLVVNRWLEECRQRISTDFHQFSEQPLDECPIDKLAAANKSGLEGGPFYSFFPCGCLKHSPVRRFMQRPVYGAGVIVCPPSLVYNWAQEIQKHLYMGVVGSDDRDDASMHTIFAYNKVNDTTLSRKGIHRTTPLGGGGNVQTLNDHIHRETIDRDYLEENAEERVVYDSVYRKPDGKPIPATVGGGQVDLTNEGDFVDEDPSNISRFIVLTTSKQVASTGIETLCGKRAQTYPVGWCFIDEFHLARNPDTDFINDDLACVASARKVWVSATPFTNSIEELLGPMTLDYDEHCPPVLTKMYDNNCDGNLKRVKGKQSRLNDPGNDPTDRYLKRKFKMNNAQIEAWRRFGPVELKKQSKKLEKVRRVINETRVENLSAYLEQSQDEVIDVEKEEQRKLLIQASQMEREAVEYMQALTRRMVIRRTNNALWGSQPAVPLPPYRHRDIYCNHLADTAEYLARLDQIEDELRAKIPEQGAKSKKAVLALQRWLHICGFFPFVTELYEDCGHTPRPGITIEKMVKVDGVIEEQSFPLPEWNEKLSQEFYRQGWKHPFLQKYGEQLFKTSPKNAVLGPLMKKITSLQDHNGNPESIVLFGSDPTTLAAIRARYNRGSPSVEADHGPFLMMHTLVKLDDGSRQRMVNRFNGDRVDAKDDERASIQAKDPCTQEEDFFKAAKADQEEVQGDDDGDGKAKNDSKSSDRPQVLAGTYGVLGQGFSCTKAFRVIFIDVAPTSREFLQGFGRICRIIDSQRNPVCYGYRLMVEGFDPEERRRISNETRMKRFEKAFMVGKEKETVEAEDI